MYSFHTSSEGGSKMWRWVTKKGAYLKGMFQEPPPANIVKYSVSPQSHGSEFANL